MRTANRNIDYLKSFAERVILSREGNNYTGDDLNNYIKYFGTPKEIDTFFDKKSIAFGKWLLQRNERTLEHSMEELMEAFNDYLSCAPDQEQVDYYEPIVINKESEDMLTTMIENLPENRPLYKDSGLWQIRSDDMKDVIFEQGVNESFFDFIKRAYDKENAFDLSTPLF